MAETKKLLTLDQGGIIAQTLKGYTDSALADKADINAVAEAVKDKVTLEEVDRHLAPVKRAFEVLEQRVEDTDEKFEGIDTSIDELQGADYRLQRDLNTTISRVGNHDTVIGALETRTSNMTEEFITSFTQAGFGLFITNQSYYSDGLVNSFIYNKAFSHDFTKFYAGALVDVSRLSEYLVQTLPGVYFVKESNDIYGFTGWKRYESFAEYHEVREVESWQHLPGVSPHDFAVIQGDDGKNRIYAIGLYESADNVLPALIKLGPNTRYTDGSGDIIESGIIMTEFYADDMMEEEMTNTLLATAYGVRGTTVDNAYRIVRIKPTGDPTEYQKIL